MFSGMIPFSSESNLNQNVFLSLLLALYLRGNTDHFTTEFPLQCLPHPEHCNLDFALIPPSHEVTSFSAFLLSWLPSRWAPFPHHAAMFSSLSFWDTRSLGLPPVVMFIPQDEVQAKMCVVDFPCSQLYGLLLCSFLAFPYLKSISSF